MGKKRLLLTGLMAVSLLAGCSVSGSHHEEMESTHNNDSETTNKLASVQTKRASEVESFMPIGKKVKIWYLQHEEYNTYQVGLRDSNKRLLWERLEPVNVLLEEDIEQSYIERIEDGSNFLGATAQFVLHIKVNTPIKGGKVYKDEHTDIQTDMIIGGGSW